MHKANKRRRLGQHHLVDPVAISKMISAAEISKTESVLEIGTGRGVLTAQLCSYAGHVISYEVDRLLAENARVLVEKFRNLEIRNADPLDLKPGYFDVFVSNLPYSRSKDTIEWLAQLTFKRAVITVQQEFADKLCARPGTKSYRAISVIAGYCFRIEKLFNIETTSFDPPPSITSSVIRLEQIRSLYPRIINRVNLLFSSRNKLASSVANRASITHDVEGRIFQLSPAELIRLAGLIENVSAV